MITQKKDSEKFREKLEKEIDEQKATTVSVKADEEKMMAELNQLLAKESK